MSRVIFPPLPAGEIRQEGFNFLSLLAAGETISSATIAVEVHSGVDASPSDLLSGSDTTVDSVVYQKFTGVGGVLGVVYNVTCTAITSLGQTLQLSAYLAVVAA